MALAITNPETSATPAEMKYCPRCEKSKPPTEYGIVRTRKDGLNLYCKACIRQKVNAQRQNNREYRLVQRARIKQEAARQKADAQAPAPAHQKSRPTASSGAHINSKKLQPEQRVVEALRCGPLAFNDLARRARLSRDELSETLPSVMLWAEGDNRVYSRNGTGSRVYFLDPPKQPDPFVQAPKLNLIREGNKR